MSIFVRFFEFVFSHFILFHRLTIIPAEHLEGCKAEDNYVLKKEEVLNRLNIKVIKLSERRRYMDIEDRVNFYVQKIFEFYDDRRA